MRAIREYRTGFMTGHRWLLSILLLGAFLALFFVTPASAQSIGDYAISDTANGGDCYLVGTWDGATSTCTLNTDITLTGVAVIEIISDGVTLDGAYHTITGSGNGNDIGVYISSRNNVTVRNLNLETFGWGIYLDSTDNSTLAGNTADSTALNAIYLSNSSFNSIEGNYLAHNAGNGVRLDGSSNNSFSGNTFVVNGGYGIHISSSDYTAMLGNDCSNNSLDGIRIDYSDSGSLADNTVMSNVNGIYLFSSNDTIMTRNMVGANSLTGVTLDNATGSTLYNNNFISNVTQASITGGSGNYFEMSPPFGGNYWDDFDEPAEGCNDSNGDGFCDSPRVFSGGQDNLPWTGFNGWLDTTPPTVTNVQPSGTIYTDTTIISVDYSDVDSGIDTSSVNVTLDGAALGGCTVSVSGVSCPVAGLGAGSHSIGGTVADSAGNPSPVTGSFDVVLCNGEKPALALNQDNVYWATYDDWQYGILSVDFSIDVPSFFDIGDIDLEGIISSNAVMPVVLPPSPVGQAFTVKYLVPPGVTNFRTTVFISATDLCGNRFDYPGPWPGA